VEVVLLLIIVGLVIAILLPVLGLSRRTYRGIQSSTQLRGIQGSLVLFAQGNNNFYPGFNGHDFTSFSTSVGWSQGAQDGRDVSQRFALLLLQNFFSGEYTISPVEIKIVWTQGTVSRANYSFAMLELPLPPAQSPNLTQALSPTGRLREWSSTINSQAPIVSDRSSVQDPALKGASVWVLGSTKPSDWRGTVAWNDNHESFERSPTLSKTRLGTMINHNDDLFTATSDADAMMSYGK
jgi:hypothetical protein